MAIKTRLIKGANLVELQENYQAFLNEEALTRNVVQRMNLAGEADMKECQEIIDVQQYINGVQQISKLTNNQVSTTFEYFLLITYR